MTTIKLVSSNLFEVPTGVFADMFGRKKSIAISFFLYSLVMFGFAKVSVFWMFVVLDILKALSNAFFSCSLESLVYDDLKERDKESKYDKVVANMETASWIGLFVAAISGGYLYHWWYRWPYIFQGIIYFIGGILALRLVEPKLDSEKFEIKLTFRKNFIGFKELFKNKLTTKMSVIFIVLGSGYFVASEMLGISQAKEYGMDSRGVGILFGIGYIISALISQAYPKLKQRLGARNLLLGICVVLLSSFLLAKWVSIWFGAILIMARIASSTTFRNIRSSLINAQISSKSRATTISTLVLLSQAPMAVLAYFLGDYIDRYSPNQFAWILGLTMVGVLAGQWLYFNKSNLSANKGI